MKNFKTVTVVILLILCLTAIVGGLTSVTHKMISHNDSTLPSTVVDEAPTKSSEQDANDGNSSDILLWSVLLN